MDELNWDDMIARIDKMQNTLERLADELAFIAEWLDTRSPTLRAAVQSEQGGAVDGDDIIARVVEAELKLEPWAGTPRPTRSDGG